jgi:alpha,alpha-trehalose phosphorylase
VTTRLEPETWIALVDGFGGMRTGGGRLAFAPRLPAGLTRLVLNLCYRGRWLRVAATRTSASYALLAGQPLQLTHYETMLTLTADGPATCPIPQAPVPRRPTQPAGREPLRRR